MYQLGSFVLDTCCHLKEKKSYVVYTVAVLACWLFLLVQDLFGCFPQVYVVRSARWLGLVISYGAVLSLISLINACIFFWLGSAIYS